MTGVRIHWRAGIMALLMALGIGLPGAWSLVRPGHGIVTRGAEVSVSGALARADAASRQSADGRAPLSFELNRGQSDGAVRFLAHGAGYTFFLTRGAAILALDALSSPPRSRPAPARPGRHASGSPGPAAAVPDVTRATQGTVVRLRFVGANAHPQVVGQQRLRGIVNYFIGSNPRGWRTRIPTYARVEYRSLYRGVNLIYHGTRGGRIEYDLVVAPGASLGVIRLAIDGARRLRLDRQGNLLLTLGTRQIRQARPVIYQVIRGHRRPIQGHYVLLGSHQVGFAAGPYDTHVPLIVDPVLGYATYLGGSGVDQGDGIAVDGAGNTYITGFTNSPNLPVAGTLQHAPSQGEDAFVVELSADGSTMLYSTYLGGSRTDQGNGIALDSAGNAYLTGLTTSTNFPILNALQATSGGRGDAFVSALSAGGVRLLYSTYLGGRGSDVGRGIAVDGAGDAYVTGSTASTDFITTTGALQTTPGGATDGFVTELQAGGALAYSTHLGGSGADQGNDIAVDGAGNATVTGSTSSTNFPTTGGAYQRFYGGNGDAFVSTLSADGSALVYSTYLGGARTDQGNGVAVDGLGNVYATGFAQSSTFPTAGALQPVRRGRQDAFVAELNPFASGGAALVYSTYLGGSGVDEGRGIAVDGAGNAYVTGSTTSTDLPTLNAPQRRNGGAADAFVMKLQPGGALTDSTYLGGRGGDGGSGIAVDSVGNVYVTGATLSPNFPATVYALQGAYGGFADAFVARVGNVPFPTPTITPTATATFVPVPTDTPITFEPIATDTPITFEPFPTDTPEPFPPFATDTPEATFVPFATDTPEDTSVPTPFGTPTPVITPPVTATPGVTATATATATTSP